MDDEIIYELLGKFNEQEGTPETDLQDLLIKTMHAQNQFKDPEGRMSQAMGLIDPARLQGANQVAQDSPDVLNLMQSGVYGGGEEDPTSNARTMLLRLLQQFAGR